MTLEQINALDREAFVALLGGLFEHSPWVAEHAWNRRPFSSGEKLWREMCAIVDAAPEKQKLALIRAHPDLGTRARVSESSAAEQAGAGLGNLNPGEYDILLEQNRRYREKFGFPFIFAVKGSGKEDVSFALMLRLDSNPEDELRQALFEIGRIAWFRLEAILGDS